MLFSFYRFQRLCYLRLIIIIFFREGGQHIHMDDVTTSAASSHVWAFVNTSHIVRSKQPRRDSCTSLSHCRTVFGMTPSLCSLVSYVGTRWTTLWSAVLRGGFSEDFYAPLTWPEQRSIVLLAMVAHVTIWG